MIEIIDDGKLIRNCGRQAGDREWLLNLDDIIDYYQSSKFTGVVKLQLLGIQNLYFNAGEIFIDPPDWLETLTKEDQETALFNLELWK